MRFAWAALLFVLGAGLPDAPQASAFEDLPPVVQRHLFALSGDCRRAGGRGGDPLAAIERFEFDGDGTPDIILDEGRYPCDGVRPDAHCSAVGCTTYVWLSQKGRWRLALDIVGSYCIDPTPKAPRFITRQRNYLVGGGYTELNVRYRFSKGMAFQERGGIC